MEVPMFTFSEPMRCDRDFEEWEEYFAKKGIFTTVRLRPDGKYDLRVMGEEANCKGSPEPIAGPCMNCGSRDHITDPNSPHYKYCSDECMKEHRNTMSIRYNGVSWDRMVELGLANKED